MTLTSQQLDILNQHAEAGDRVAYYEALDSFGDIYGRLALGVVCLSSGFLEPMAA
ncbi:hypothetical protein [uncultured Roseobacter sp.]|uniref:hypothetical protein n=1 Tax=uncultured Roseobacter sp. TaxID=114847 RepID=UPI0026040C55|nr:hypothetical protein [uncultured Roseobacter sp.]